MLKLITGATPFSPVHGIGEYPVQNGIFEYPTDLAIEDKGQFLAQMFFYIIDD